MSNYAIKMGNASVEKVMEIDLIKKNKLADFSRNLTCLLNVPLNIH